MIQKTVKIFSIMVRDEGMSLYNQVTACSQNNSGYITGACQSEQDRCLACDVRMLCLSDDVSSDGVPPDVVRNEKKGTLIHMELRCQIHCESATVFHV